MSEQGHGTPSSPTAPRPEVPKMDDPKEYIQAFKDSPVYASAFDEFYQGKTLAPDVTDQEKRDVFEGTESGKGALLTFAEKNLMFSYAPSKFDPATREAINDYIDTVRDFFKIYRGGSQDEIVSADSFRSAMHNKAADALADNGYVSTNKQGRTLARIILIERGLDTFDHANISDIERVRRQLGETG